MYYQPASGIIEGSYMASDKFKDGNLFRGEEEYNGSSVNPIPTDSSVVPKLSFLLSQLVSSQCDHLHGNFTPFHTYTIPEISIRAYLDRIANYFRCSNECFVLALIYINRIGKLNRSTFNLSIYNIHRLLSTSVMIATKYTDDVYFSNGFYAQVSGLHIRELNSLEYLFLKLIDFSLFVSTPEYETFRSYIMNCAPYNINRKIDFKVAVEDSNHYLGNSSRKQCFKSYNYVRGDHVNCVPCDISTASSVSYEPSDKSSANSSVLSPDIAMKQIAYYDVQKCSPAELYYSEQNNVDYTNPQVFFSTRSHMKCDFDNRQEYVVESRDKSCTTSKTGKNENQKALRFDNHTNSSFSSLRNCRSANVLNSTSYSSYSDISTNNCDFRRIECLGRNGNIHCDCDSSNLHNQQFYNYRESVIRKDKKCLSLNNNISTALHGPNGDQNSPFPHIMTNETISCTKFHCSQFPIEHISHHISGF